MLGAMAANSTRPVISGELLRCRTSIGNATVDIRLPNIEMDEPPIKIRKRAESELSIWTLRDRAASGPAGRPARTDKLLTPGPASARPPREPSGFAVSATVGSRFKGEVPPAQCL